MEMISVLPGSSMVQAGFSGRGPAVGLFADRQIRLLDGPLLVNTDYDLQRDVVALSRSRRTESARVRTRVLEAGTRHQVTEMILKHSHAKYGQDARALAQRT